MRCIGFGAAFLRVNFIAHGILASLHRGLQVLYVVTCAGFMHKLSKLCLRGSDYEGPLFSFLFTFLKQTQNFKFYTIGSK